MGKIEEIHNRANQILCSSKIDILSKDEKILSTLNKILQTNEIGYNMEILDNIEEYISTKEKIKITNDDYKFLTKLSQELKEQSVRITDITFPPLFVVKTNNEDFFFLTRKSAKEFISLHNIEDLNKTKIIEISSYDSMELAKLLEIIKRNF